MDAVDVAHAHWRAGRLQAALSTVAEAFIARPSDVDARALLVRLLGVCHPTDLPDPERTLRRLLADPGVDPGKVCFAGWNFLLESPQRMPSKEGQAVAIWLEQHDFALELLAASCVTVIEAEWRLTAARRWLLLSNRAREFPRAVMALAAQVEHNQGAWLFDEDERRAREGLAGQAIVRAYAPGRPHRGGTATFANPITREVATQYEQWPYPLWTRITRRHPTSLAADLSRRDPDGPRLSAAAPEILVAGCGTGREAAVLAQRYPDARITAIDCSAASLRYGMSRCGALGFDRVNFHQLDLHDAATAGWSFDAIFCSGVLHHLPDPEAGWAALNRVLRPGGVMRIMVYSTLARLRVRRWQIQLRDLRDQPVTEHVLREARRRLMAFEPPVSNDFFNLNGVHDLLMHRHEDPFDVRRIQRALSQLGLKLLCFELPTPKDLGDYEAAFPNDFQRRDFGAWAAFERKRPLLFAGMYEFWCRKPSREHPDPTLRSAQV